MVHGRFEHPLQGALTGVLDRVRAAPLASRIGPELRLDGRTVLLTGASAGLGRAIALDLARRGARLLLVCRSRQEETLTAVRAVASAEVQVLGCDLSSLSQVHTLADRLRGEQLDVYIGNAGVATPSCRRTADGLDEMFAVNVLAQVVLCRRLVADGALREGARLIFVSSDSHQGASAIDLPALGVPEDYGPTRGIHLYSYYKLVLNTFAVELGRRLEGHQAVHVSCPGPVNSEIVRDAPTALRLALRAVFTLAFPSPAQAARPYAWLAGSPDLDGRTLVYTHVLREKRMDPKCYDPEAGHALWDRLQALREQHDPRAAEGA
jgi:NAD(P)-dependent dehydrogenase (short-subunit alcohol dehydrogenase family)